MWGKPGIFNYTIFIFMSYTLFQDLLTLEDYCWLCLTGNGTETHYVNSPLMLHSYYLSQRHEMLQCILTL